MPNPQPNPTRPDPRRWQALGLLCTAFFMAILDSSVVLVALPSIDADLGFAPEDLQWVMSAYFLSFGGLLLLGGRTADLLGRRRVFITGAGLFGLASLGAGLAGTDEVLIAARAIQGLAAAVMTPTAMSILTTTFQEGSERNRALGIWTATGATAGTTGWLIGGPITDGLGWEWIFFLNVPIAAAACALSPVLLRESRAAVDARRFDFAGAATITAALVALVYAVVEAPEAGWGSEQTLGLLALAAVLAALFAVIEAWSAAPLVPPHVLRSRVLVGGNLVLLALGTLAFGIPFVLTQYGQQILGWSPMEFGVAFFVSPVMVGVTSSIGQAVATRRGVRPVAVVALVLAGLSALLLTQVSVEGSYLGDFFPGVFLLGLGIGGAYVAGSIASVAGVDESDAGLASGLSNASFQIGAAIGVAVVSTVAVSGADGGRSLDALNRGYQDAFAVSIVFAVLGVALAGLLLGTRRGRAVPAEAEPAGAGAESGGPAYPPVVDRATWGAERQALLVREKAHTHEGDAIAAARRRLPMVEVDAAATLIGPSGPTTLLEAFEGRRQLIAYFHMWYPGQPAAAQCEGCTFYNGQVRELAYLHARDVTYATFCHGPYDESVRYRDFMGWDMPWYSVQHAADSLLDGRPAGMFYLVCYLRRGDRVFETYETRGRGVEVMAPTWGLLDLTVYGRQETWESSPDGWPQPWPVEPDSFRTDGRPTAQVSRLEAGRSDDLTAPSADPLTQR